MSFDASARSSEGQNVMVKDSRKSDKSYVCSTAHVSTNVWLAGGAILILGCRSQSHSKAGPLSLPHLSIFFVKRVVDSHRWEVLGSAYSTDCSFRLLRHRKGSNYICIKSYWVKRVSVAIE